MMSSNTEYFDCSKNDHIMMEPRLVEYLKKLKYYKDNYISIPVTLDREFNISEQDKMTIRAFLRKDKKLYEYIKHTDLIDPTNQEFPSSKWCDFKKDPHFERLMKKQQRDKDAQKHRHNYGNISRRYDMYRDDRPFASALGNDFTASDFHPNQWIDEQPAKAKWKGNDKPSNPFWLQESKEVAKNEDWNPYRVEEINKKRQFSTFGTYENDPPNIRFNDYLPWGNNSELKSSAYSLDSIIGEIDSYRNKVNQKYQQENNMDLDMKIVTPSNNCNDLRESENIYQPVPYMGGNTDRDLDVDNYIRFGSTPSRGAKSLGYPNPVDHYFQFISNDIQIPEHTVFERPQPTRTFNKVTARPKSHRDILP